MGMVPSIGSFSFHLLVIPAKAGIQRLLCIFLNALVLKTLLFPANS